MQAENEYSYTYDSVDALKFDITENSCYGGKDSKADSVKSKTGAGLMMAEQRSPLIVQADDEYAYMSYDSAAVSKFDITENSCYGGEDCREDRLNKKTRAGLMAETRSPRKSSPSSPSSSSSSCRLFPTCVCGVLVAGLLVCVVGACIYFVFEINRLKSEMALLQTVESAEDSSQEQLQQIGTLERMVENATLQVSQELNKSHNELDEILHELNTSYEAFLVQFQSSMAQIELLNGSSTLQMDRLFPMLNAEIQQLNEWLNQNLSNTVRQLAESSMRNHSLLIIRIQQLSSQVGQLTTLSTQNYTLLSNRVGQLELNECNADIGTVFSSCNAIPRSFPSGYYCVRLPPTGSSLSSNSPTIARVYCDMTRSCGPYQGGWRRVAHLDMRNSSHQCPRGLRYRYLSGKRVCGASPSTYATCSSVIFPSLGIEYSRVCGRIRAYQYGSTDAFGNSYGGRGSNPGIDTFYVDGISLTRGSPRQHIWTFASGLDEANSDSRHNCFCTNARSDSTATRPPSFVGSDYFCETGAGGSYTSYGFHPNDPLWDGAGCGSASSCCTFNSPPWFYKSLGRSTSDYIEMRLCKDEGLSEDIPIESFEIFVHK